MDGMFNDPQETIKENRDGKGVLRFEATGFWERRQARKNKRWEGDRARWD
jgi:hypothetical protein